MAKSHVYSWRVSSEMLAALERAANEEGRSVSAHLEHVVGEDLARRGAGGDDDAQRRVHAAAAALYGSLSEGPRLDATRVRARVRARLRKRHAG